MPASPASGCRAFVQALRVYAESLRVDSVRLDSINVYPVPDFDTGSNLRFTVRDALVQIESVSTWHDIPAAVARGSLIGARGNCGVLLSQYLRPLGHAIA